MRFGKRRKGIARDEPSKAIGIGFGWQIGFWLLIGLVLAASSVYGGWTVVGRPPIASGGKELPTETLLDLVKISLTVVAGVGGIVALVVAYRKQRLGEAQHRREEASARREDQKLYSERFSKASELLGSERSAVRLAAVYALGNLADDWETGRQTCIDVLCAYLRMPYKPLTAPPIDKVAPKENQVFERQTWRNAIMEESSLNASEEQQVRSTIVRVIVEHLNPDIETPWFGTFFNFSGALLESPNFGDAHFVDCRVDFGDAFIYGEATFSFCKFEDSDVSFTSAVIGGRCEFEVCEFLNSKVDLTATVIPGGQIYIYDGIMKNTKITGYGLQLGQGDFTFMQMHMEGSKLELGTIDYSNSTIALSRCDVTNSTIAVRNAICSHGSLFISGIRIREKGRVLFGVNHFNAPDNLAAKTDAQFYLNDVGIDGGFLGFQRQKFVRTPLKWEALEITNGGELIISECELEQSPVSFVDSMKGTGARLVIDICADADDVVSLDGLGQDPADEMASVITRLGAVSDVPPSRWTQPKTSFQEDHEPQEPAAPWY